MLPLCLQALCVNRLIKAKDVFIDRIKKKNLFDWLNARVEKWQSSKVLKEFIRVVNGNTRIYIKWHVMIFKCIIKPPFLI